MTTQQHLGEVKIKNIKVHTDKTSSVKEILKLADEIWTEVKNSGIDIKDEKKTDRFFTRLRAKYEEFAKSFPIVFRWMVQTNEYNAKAFEKFLKTHVKMMYEDRKAYLRAQAEYLVLLYKERNPRCAGTHLAKYRETVIKSLEKDDKVFAEANKEAAEEVKKMDKEIDKDRRQRLIEFIKNRQ